MRFSSSATQPPTEISIPTYKKKSSASEIQGAECKRALQAAKVRFGCSAAAAWGNGSFRMRCTKQSAAKPTDSAVVSVRKLKCPRKKAIRKGESAAPIPQEKFSKLTAAATFEEGNCVARRLTEGLAKP